MRSAYPADVEIYPREGTETQTSDIFPLLHVLKFIPVRGRKLYYLFITFIIISVEIYPREGTETRRKYYVRNMPQR